ncbi:hypothetical protein F4780DRAFT_775259 [Xylariomycetidae sp. FL0641]|nr:hypothetical protein F4780DRAFT_775259 [Xylariomycetidae sp. FL0641]
MMLTLKQPVHYGYRPVHDLPTPPRTSPPVTVQDSFQRHPSALQTTRSPPTESMSAPHRGLPPPAAMTLPQHQAAPGPPHHAPPPGPPPLPVAGGPAPSPHNPVFGALPPPPHQWQGSEEAMRSWLIAKAEEDRRRQEEERTRQESLRLEQRKIEHDMLRTSLDRGVPPAMVPVVFAGMSGAPLPQIAAEWVQQYLPSHQGHPQLLPPQGPLSPDHHRRESQVYGQYATSVGVPSTPGSGPGTQAGFVPYQGPGSPSRPRAHTLTMGAPIRGPLGSSALPRLSTGETAGGPGGPHGPHGMPQQQTAAPQQETQSPSIYFHHWQPPNSQGGSSQPAAPSGLSKSKPSK